MASLSTWMFCGEALTTDDRTACRFDTAEAGWEREISCSRAVNRIGLERGRPNALPTMTALDFRSFLIIHIVQGALWTSPLGLEGLLTNPGTPGGKVDLPRFSGEVLAHLAACFSN